MNRRVDGWGRREFLGGLGATGLVGLRGGTAAAEPPPETTKLALAQSTSICHAPQYVAEALLKAEGFTEVHYVKDAGGGVEARPG